jgi:addiction module RelE/StbE family toxin
MDIIFHKKFVKAFEKLTLKQQQKVDEIITIFRLNPQDDRLDNHALHGQEKGNRSISAGGDLRLIFEEVSNYETVIFYRVGSHSQLYE